jgi:hypothetical protein
LSHSQLLTVQYIHSNDGYLLAPRLLSPPTHLQVLPRRLNTPRLARQARQPVTVLARVPSAQGSRLWHVGGLADVRGALLQGREQRLDRLGRQILVVVVVDLDHGRVGACTQALNLDKGEEAVGGRLALLDAEVLGYGLDDLVAAAAA